MVAVLLWWDPRMLLSQRGTLGLRPAASPCSSGGLCGHLEVLSSPWRSPISPRSFQALFTPWANPRECLWGWDCAFEGIHPLNLSCAGDVAVGLCCRASSQERGR